MSKKHAGAAIAVALALAAALAACGGGDGNGGDGATSQDSRPAPTPKLLEAAGFPRAANQSMRNVIGGLLQGPELAPTVSLILPGRQRFGFALFDRGNRQIAGARVGLYVSRGLDETARGPYPARSERLAVDGRYRSKQTAQDPDAARSVYVAKLSFPSSGTYLVSAAAELGNQLVATSPVEVSVSARSPVPDVGDRAISVHTPTRASVGGDLSKIDTRTPPDSMHEVDLADALQAHHPVLLLFATPALCESRVCGPVTDIAEQVNAQYGDRVDFIHMEVYKDNDISKGPRPQFSAWHLRQEPFAFAIDSRGIVVARLQGAFSARELTAAVRRAMG